MVVAKGGERENSLMDVKFPFVRWKTCNQTLHPLNHFPFLHPWQPPFYLLFLYFDNTINVVYLNHTESLSICLILWLLISLNIISSSFFHLAAYVNFPPCKDGSTSAGMYAPHFDYLFIINGHLNWFHLLPIVNNAMMRSMLQISVQDPFGHNSEG